MLMYKLHVKLTQKCMRHAMIPKYIVTPNLGFLPQIIYRHALSSTLLELKPKVKVTVTCQQLVTRQGPRCIYIPNMECYHKQNRRSAVGAFFQELIPEVKVPVDENSEGHSMTTTYIHKLNLGVNMASNMRHALTGFAQTCKNLTLVQEKSAFCPGIVLEFCKIILENIN